jgi:hypothetical protein
MSSLRLEALLEALKSSLRLEALLEALGGGEVTLRLAALTMC